MGITPGIARATVAGGVLVGGGLFAAGAVKHNSADDRTTRAVSKSVMGLGAAGVGLATVALPHALGKPLTGNFGITAAWLGAGMVCGGMLAITQAAFQTS